MSKGEGKEKEEDIVFIRKIIYKVRKNIRGRNKGKMRNVGEKKKEEEVKKEEVD